MGMLNELATVIAGTVKTNLLMSAALDIQNCGITEQTAMKVLQMLRINTSVAILDMRQNPEISSLSLSKVRATLREHERGGLGVQVSTVLTYVFN